MVYIHILRLRLLSGVGGGPEGRVTRTSTARGRQGLQDHRLTAEAFGGGRQACGGQRGPEAHGPSPLSPLPGREKRTVLTDHGPSG